jgi:hypothetical protein
MLAVGVEPLVPYPGATTGWKSRCLACNRIVAPHYSSIQQGGNGCRFCAKGGIDFAAPGFIYIVTHHQMRAVKVGIANEPTSRHDRVKLHERRGWITEYLLGFPSADDAFRVEQAVLRWLRVERGLAPVLKSHQTPQGGWTETANLDDVSALALWRRVLSEARTQGWSIE